MTAKKSLNKKCILENIYVAVQRASDEQLVKRNCELEGLELYLYIRLESDDIIQSAKLTPAHLLQTDITLNEAWSAALEHSYKETEIIKVTDILSECFAEEFPETDPMLWVITNKCRTKGASAILNKNALSLFAARYGTDSVIVLPSSVHEMIILPFVEGMELDHFSNMVKEININEVSPEERLIDTAYILKV